ncbi:hypothetical protein V3M66_00185 [Trueperella pyogenes]|uniref:Nmad4 family putative nucleotide modification protein n=1 Tax=Trueperella pyogenes TaxID=1661 RepID=UPI00345C840A
MSNETRREMEATRTEKDLKATVKVRGNMMPLGEWIIATRWAWNYDRNEMGYQAFLYRYTTDERGPEAPITLAVTSADDFEDFHTQAEAGAWAMGMILAHD